MRDARRVAATAARIDRAADSATRSRRARRTAVAAACARATCVVRYGDVVAVRGVDLDLAAGEVTALMGRNGSGKSSLLWAMQGSGKRQSGLVEVDGEDPKTLSALATARTLVGLVPQTPADLLYLETVARRARPGRRRVGRRAIVATARALLDRLAPGIPDDMHPRDLSEGQRLVARARGAAARRATPSCCSTSRPAASTTTPSASLVRIVHDLAADGRAVVDRDARRRVRRRGRRPVVVMADGDIVADGPTADVVVASPAFAPQVAKILAPLAFLTVDQVRAALDVVASRP